MRARSLRAGKSILLVGIIVALVAGGVGAGVFLGPKLLGHGKKTAAADKGKEKHAEEGKSEKREAKQDGGKETDAVVVPLGEFLVNLASSGGVRYLKAEVSLSIAGLPEQKKGEGSKEESPLPAGLMAVVKDRVVAVLSAGDFAQLRSVGGREALKQKVKARVQESLPDYEVTQVLFTSFVMQ